MSSTATVLLLRMPQLVLAMAAVAGDPATTVDGALADLETVPAALRPQTRYLALYNVPLERRQSVTAAAGYLLNAVSRSRTIAKPISVQGDLLRIDLAAYADPQQPESYLELHAAWEELAADDPYFHLTTQVVTAGGLKTVTVDGGWIDLGQAERLRQLTGSFGSVLRADFFIARVSRPPDYYAWAAVPARQQELFVQLGLDVKVVSRLAADSAANLLRSQVTGKPRRVIYRPGPQGGVWLTKDVARVAADRDPLRSPLDFKTQRFVFDATELFFARANGLWGTALFDAQGVRQDAVPQAIASDTTAPAGHQELVPIISCIRCHELNGGRAGLQPFADDQSALPPVRSDEPVVERRALELYDPVRLARRMLRDREDYAEAVALATGGLSTEQAAIALTETFAAHVYRPVTIESAAAELGLEAETLNAALGGSGDPIVLALLRGLAVDRASWESSFQEAALLAAAHRSGTVRGAAGGATASSRPSNQEEASR
ncbi:MAG: hypothetical protein WD847_04740 [Pirellulales bacterium]